ncbi:hypothetical protein C4K19_3264 [Pseudomonas chlororaphis subsp. aurantiaca]|nr:hypothetical protein C4K19_3264 [Pseudomonas chlororaphis subsp. aurantiaca]AZD73611.1 hypothetical protein C4K16_3251 [Pseudomonas chlororaphis subsp. aurantiaca]
MQVKEWLDTRIARGDQDLVSPEQKMGHLRGDDRLVPG